MAVAQPGPRSKRQKSPASSPPAAFADIPRDPAGHFRLHFYAAVFYLANYLYHSRTGDQHGLGQALEAFPFLGRYLGELKARLPEKIGWQASIAWWDAQLKAWEEGRELQLPLCRAFAERAERIALVLIGLVEEEPRFGAFFSALEDRPGARRPALATVESVMIAAGAPSGVCARLLERGAVTVVDPDAPRSEWELRVPQPLWRVVRGDAPGSEADGYRLIQREELPERGELAGLEPEMTNLPQLVREGKVRALVVRGSPGSDRLRAVGAAARLLGLNLLVLEYDAARAKESPPWLGVLAQLTGSLPVFQVDPLPGETLAIPPLKGYNGLVAVASGLFGGIAFDDGIGLGGLAGASAVTITLPRLGPHEREALWRRALGERASGDVNVISERLRLPAGYIRRAAGLAAAQAELAGRAQVTFADVRAAVRLLGREALETVAVRLETGGSWNDLVASPAVVARLMELQRRCIHRERLPDALGDAFRSQPSRGVKALFSGPSGTGKSLAAKILASELGMDLYQIDLSAVVSKYVGETEKNLHRALTAAEELDVVLLLDEGDALLGKRSEVRGANDRYANLETNFLLQRLEAYEGIVFITTNAAENIDPAFQRRMDAVIAFPLPGARERLAIWRLHLPAGHGVDEAFLEHVAQICAFNGGQIRNVVQHAALLALDEGGPIKKEHLIAAVRSEYQKRGALCPLQDDEGPRPASGGSAPSLFMDAVAKGGMSRGRRDDEEKTNGPRAAG